MWREKLSYRQVATRFDLRGNTVVSTWERLYHEGGVDALKPKSGTRPKRIKMKIPEPEKSVPNDDKRTLKELLKENESLRAEVAYLKKLDALVRAEQAAPKKRKPSPD
jgi:transposase